MKQIRLFLTVFLLVVSVAGVLAQNITVTGTVTDSQEGYPLLGAGVQVKGQSGGVATDLDGHYSIEVNANDVLVFSYINYTTAEVAVNGKAIVNVSLTEDAVALDDVIVVAYGTIKREAQTGSVTTVKGEAISSSPATSVDKMLSGKMAGVSVTAATGQPGAASQIRIRGTSSINAGSEPLWVVDGIPVMTGDQSYFTNTGNAMSNLNPNDIESLTVLKDAAATSIYGSRAANGVILVTTKSGSLGKAKFTATAKAGVSKLANDNNFRMMTGEELLDYQRTAAVNAGFNPDDPNSAYYRPMSLIEGELTDWTDHFSRLGVTQDYEISASGGNAKGKFYASVAYHNNEGVYYGVDYGKITARVNADYKLKDNLEIGTRVNLAHTSSNDVPMQSLYYTNPAWAGLTILPWTPKYDEFGNHNVNISENSNSNPRYTAENDQQWEEQYRVQATAYLQWEPIKNLVLKTNNSAEGTFGKGRRYWAPDPGGLTGTLQSSTSEFLKLTTSNTATYSNTIADDHSYRILVGQEATRDTYESMYLYSPEVDVYIPYPNTSTPAADEGSYDTSVSTLMSFFGMVDYNYASKYFLQGSLRYDGSSLFGANNQWGLFWSVGASWNMRNEPWLKDVHYLDRLKLRASYGVNGNNSIAAYKAYGVYAPTTYNGTTGMMPSSPSNDNLSWEKNYTWNVGVDFGFFSRLSGSIDAYNRDTKDMLLSKNVPQTSGFSSNFMNIGSLSNKGIEFQIEGDIFTQGDFSLNAGFNVAYNKTELLDLGDVESMGSTWCPQVVGKSFYTYYLKDYYGVNPTNGEALWRAADPEFPEDESKYILTNNYNDARYVYAGSPEPDFIGGFNTTLSWKGLSLSAYFEFKQGNEVMILNEGSYLNADGGQMSMNQMASSLNYWKNPGDVGVTPKPVAGNTSNSANAISTRWMEDGSYTRLKDVTLSYSLPNNIIEKLNLGGVRIYVSGYNLYTFHDVTFWDPERGTTGAGAGIYPMTKTIIGGIELSF